VNADVQGGARAVESADIRMRGLTPLLAPAAAAAQGPAAGLQSGDPRKKP
jgi:hypothetical protein